MWITCGHRHLIDLVLFVCVVVSRIPVARLQQFNVVALTFDPACHRDSSVLAKALQHVRHHPQLRVPSVEVKVQIRSPMPGCRSGGLLPLVQALGEQDVNAVIGVVAEHVCEAAATVAHAHQKLLVSWGCSTAGITSRPRSVQGLIRTVPTAISSVDSMVVLLMGLRWKYSAVLVEDTEEWVRVGTVLQRSMRDAGLAVKAMIVLNDNATQEDVMGHLLTIKSPIKAVILLMDVMSPLLSTVLTASAHLRLTDGRMAFFTFHVATPLYPRSVPEVPEDAEEALRALFVVTALPANVTYEQIWDENTTAAFERIIQETSRVQAYDYYRYFDTLSFLFTAIRLQPSMSPPFLLEPGGVIFPSLAGNGQTDESGEKVVTFVLLDFDPRRKAFWSVTSILLDADPQGLRQRMSDVDWPGGLPLQPDSDCVFYEINCHKDGLGIPLSHAETAAVGTSILLFGLVAFVVFATVKRKLLLKEIKKKIFLTTEDLVFTHPTRKGFCDCHSFERNVLKGSSESLRTHTRLSSSQSVRFGLEDRSTCARLNGDFVHLKYLITNIPFEVKAKSVQQLRLIYELRHENVNPFLGCLANPERPALVWEYCSRGSLYDVLVSEDIKLDWTFKLSLLTDLVRGMRYLHNSPVKHHGHLTSRNCVIDSRWVLKVTDYGLPAFYEAQNVPMRQLSQQELLWTAPELLRDPGALKTGSQEGDVYSFAIVMQEVLVRGDPFCMLQLTPEEIVAKLKHPPPLIRPSVSKQAAPPEAINIMRQCWTENPDMRPDFHQISDQFKRLNQGRKVNIVDTMFQMLEKYSNNLEDLIKERTVQLDEEKKKTDQLLNRMLPCSVADNLKSGLPVTPEKFEEVSIYFSDIVGFTTISAYSEPMEIVDLLNDLYTAFDSTINNYKVYKVETIGDAYMVVSGLPQRSKDHAEQIATMALDVLHVCGKFKIRHMPTVPLMLRIGIHTGPVVAGVVGLTMPRYCLFGDTVNTASRMESTGRAYRIHISKTTEKKLRQAGGYHIQYRGEIILKGRGKQPTYWLTGKDGFDKELPTPAIDAVAVFPNFFLQKNVTPVSTSPLTASRGENHGFPDEQIFKALGRTKNDQEQPCLPPTSQSISSNGGTNNATPVKPSVTDRTPTFTKSYSADDSNKAAEYTALTVPSTSSASRCSSPVRHRRMTFWESTLRMPNKILPEDCKSAADTAKPYRWSIDGGGGTGHSQGHIGLSAAKPAKFEIGRRDSEQLAATSAQEMTVAHVSSNEPRACTSKTTSFTEMTTDDKAKHSPP